MGEVFFSPFWIREQDFRIFAEYTKDSSVTFLFGVPLCKYKLLSFSHLQEEAENSVYIFFLKGCFWHLTIICIIFFCVCFVSSFARFWMSPKITKYGFLLYFLKKIQYWSLFLRTENLHLSSVGTEGPKRINVYSEKLADVTFRRWLGEWILMLIAHSTSLGLLAHSAWSKRSQSRQSQV